jgi:calcineurin-like phosphoesterase family protein
MRIDYKGSLDKLFLTSDTHFFHERIIEFSSRPFKNNEHQTNELIRLWNEVVPEDGVVIHHGDLCWTGNIDRIIWLLQQLNGSITLIYGNHDYQNKLDREIIKGIFKSHGGDTMDIANILVREDNNQQIIGCHYPMLFWPRGAIMTHGHIHSGPLSKSSEKAPFSPMRYDVGVDNCNYKPISYLELKEIIEQQKLSILDGEKVSR